MDKILDLQQLSKTFGYLVAVNQLTFTIEKGNIYGILGPNGSGKSTTLGMLLNVVNATSGAYSWFNGSLNTHEALKKVGAIIERPNFYPYMSAYQNLKLVCKIKDVPYDRIDEVLETVDLIKRKHSKFSAFSLGMKQRLAIASALLNNPEVLILDEPTNGLDPQGIHQIRELIKVIAANGTTILLASHLLDEVEKVCTHVVVLQKGNKLYSGRVDELVSSHGFFELNSNDNQALMALLEKNTSFGKLTYDNDLIVAFLNEPLSADALNTLAFNNNITLSQLVKRKESLETQFLKLTNQN